MPRYPFLGLSSRFYGQYRDLGSDSPLLAQPGRSYDMAPVASLPLPVPPDGLWGPAQDDGAKDAGPENAPLAPDDPGEPPGVPLPLLTSTEGEED